HRDRRSRPGEWRWTAHMSKRIAALGAQRGAVEQTIGATRGGRNSKLHALVSSISQGTRLGSSASIARPERRNTSYQLAGREELAQLGCNDQGAMDLRASPSTAEGGPRSRSLRGKVLAWPKSSCVDDLIAYALLQHLPPHKKWGGKKESTARHLNRPCQPR